MIGGKVEAMVLTTVLEQCVAGYLEEPAVKFGVVAERGGITEYREQDVVGELGGGIADKTTHGEVPIEARVDLIEEVTKGRFARFLKEILDE